MEFEDLKRFLHLSRSLHYGKTSSECHVSPSTLSRAIQRLEEACGRPLFERDRRNVELTFAGQQFREFALETIERWDLLHQTFQQDETILRGELTLFCSLTASYCLLPNLLKKFHKEYPEVNIKIITGDANVAMERVIQGDAELCITPLPKRVPQPLATHLIDETPLQLIIPRTSGHVRKLMMRDRIPWEVVPVILQDLGIIRNYLLSWFRRKNIKPNVYSHVAGHEAILVLVSLGLGIGVIPKLVLDHSLIKAQVDMSPFQLKFPDFKVALGTPKSFLKKPLVRAFWDIVCI